MRIAVEEIANDLNVPANYQDGSRMVQIAFSGT